MARLRETLYGMTDGHMAATAELRTVPIFSFLQLTDANVSLKSLLRRVAVLSAMPRMFSNNEGWLADEQPAGKDDLEVRAPSCLIAITASTYSASGKCSTTA